MRLQGGTGGSSVIPCTTQQPVFQWRLADKNLVVTLVFSNHYNGNVSVKVYGLIGISCLLFAATADVAGESARIQRDYSIVRASLRERSDGFAVKDSAATSSLLSRAWSLIAEWTIARAQKQPSLTASEIESYIKQLDSQLDVSVASLGGRTYAIGVNNGEIGTVFLISSVSQRFTVVWSIEREANRAMNDEQGVSAWSARSARNRGMYGRVHALPAPATGHPRFYVEGTYAQSVGATVTGQLTIWEWNGRTAKLLFSKIYPHFIDGPASSLDGDILRVSVKESLKTFFACGGCPEPVAEWSIRIGADHIDDLGVQWTVPEMRALDELFYQIQRRKDAVALASTEVITKLSHVIEDIRGKAEIEHDYAPLGMLMDWKVERRDGASRVCLSIDGLTRYLFTITRLERGLYVNAVQDVDDVAFGEDCTQVLAGPVQQ